MKRYPDIDDKTKNTFMKLLGLETYDKHTFIPKLLSLFFDKD